MISVGFKTDRGKLRDDNEDSLFILPEQQLYIVADGVGGHKSGELASRLAVGYIAQYVALNPVSEIQSEASLKRYFSGCFEGANELVYSKATGENTGMATTAVVTYLRDGKAYVVNVGDSRAYLIRDGVIRQITVDHTYVGEMIRHGLMTEEEAKVNPDKNMITRAIGGEQKVNPDFFSFDYYPGDMIIMCSDGLYGEVPETVMALMASRALTMRNLAKDLVEQANRHGGKDNVSVVCIKIG